MRLRTAVIGAAVAVVGIVAVGASLIFGAHENGRASNGGCDEFFWQSREPGEDFAGENSIIKASSPADAQVIISQRIVIPCDGTQQITFNGSAFVSPGTDLHTYIRLTCQSGDCMNRMSPPFSRQQVCAPGDNLEPGNNRGMVVLGNTNVSGDVRASVTQVTFCGATPPGNGQIAQGNYLVEVFAFQTATGGTAAGNGARFAERSLSNELWGIIGTRR